MDYFVRLSELFQVVSASVRLRFVNVKLCGERMEVEVRLVRANVWLSSSADRSRSELLALATLPNDVRAVESGTIAAPSDIDASPTKKVYRFAQIHWAERPAASRSRSRFTLPQESCSARLYFQLFVLHPSIRPTPKHKKPKRIPIRYLASSEVALASADVEALLSSQEIVFVSTLSEGHGAIEVAVRCVSSPTNGEGGDIASDTGTAHVDHQEGSPTNANGSFSVNWSSSEALQKDREEQEKKKAEDEKLLAHRLAKIAAEAKHARELLEQEVNHRRTYVLARVIQTAYRVALRRRLEEQERVRREAEMLAQAKKALVRDQVIARNLHRARNMRKYLEAVRNEVATPVQPNPAFRGEYSVVVPLMIEREQQVRSKLRAKLAQLEAAKQEKLRSIEPPDSDSNSGLRVDEALMHAIRAIHLGNNVVAEDVDESEHGDT